MCNSGDTLAVCAGWSCVGALNVVRRQVGVVQLRVHCSLAGVFIFSVPCFLFLSFPSDQDSSTKSSVNKIGKTASRSGSPALNDPTLTNLVRNYPYNSLMMRILCEG